MANSKMVSDALVKGTSLVGVENKNMKAVIEWLARENGNRKLMAHQDSLLVAIAKATDRETGQAGSE
eukprot:CAMPEP_0172485174 /NCGR_PEP_ID=MMETSP1066-20121228/13041_1 /TAXON_ID=671091 /ORGANISM="Coscinodiscus wailesii, Strain CCMP2513" /LENGTH=66 /DNA_ID=CAMNT_0013250209 /DNA_START=368 /DNA_END=568 /DNA_ORIENTATION=+